MIVSATNVSEKRVETYAGRVEALKTAKTLEKDGNVQTDRRTKRQTLNRRFTPYADRCGHSTVIANAGCLRV